MNRQRGHGRVPFDFRRRVELARMYLDDHAYITCAERLEELAASIRTAENERRAHFGLPLAPGAIHIVFDSLPGPEGPRFVEVETPGGRSVKAGEWRTRPDGFAELVIQTHGKGDTP